MQNQKEKVMVKIRNFSPKKILMHVIIIALILFGCMYVIWQNYQNKLELTSQIQQLQQKLSEQNLANTEKAKNIQPSFGLSEVQYLIRLANIDLVINRDVSKAIQLLTIADQHLATLMLSEPDLVEVRQALTDDLSALKMLVNVDRIGIILQINALSDQISKLPIPSIPNTVTKASTQLVKPENNSATLLPQTFWQKFITTNWQQLQKIIIVQHHEQPVIPILSEEQQLEVIQKMQLALNQVEWAVLHNQSIIYQTALQKVIDLANHYFSNNPIAANAIIKTVKELQAINITPKLPELTSSLQAIDKVIKSTAGNDKL